MNKPSLIFLHGLRGSHEGLEDITKHFSNYQIFTPDIPPNHIPLTEYTSTEYAKWLANYILDNKIDRPILIGHSFGSIISAATAEKFPELINEKLVFIAPISEKHSKFFHILIPQFQFLPDKLIDYVITRFLLIPNDRDLFKYSLKSTELSRQNIYSRLDIVKCAQFCAEHSINDFNFKKSLFIIAGKTDRLNPLTKTKNIAKKHDAILKVIPRTGHLINFEEPDLVAKEILNFIEK